MFKGAPTNWIPTRSLSDNPIKPKPYLSSKQTKPTPSSSSSYKLHSVTPNQTNPHKNGSCKYPINNSPLRCFRLKQRRIPFTPHGLSPLPLQAPMNIYHPSMVSYIILAISLFSSTLFNVNYAGMRSEGLKID